MPEVTTQSNVQTTTNYRLFSMLETNREVVPAHVNRIKESIDQVGNFTEVVPILVNEHFQIIDGQHRFTALKELGLPVHYTVTEGTTADTARIMNAMQRNWTPRDFLDSYAKEGVTSYVKLQRILEEFPDVQVHIATVFATGSSPAGLQAKFRRGEFPDFDEVEALERFKKLDELMGLNPVFGRKVMALAVLTMLRNAEYDHNRMVRKVRQLSPEILPYQGITNNLRQLEEVYNHMRTEANRTRFF